MVGQDTILTARLGVILYTFTRCCKENLQRKRGEAGVKRPWCLCRGGSLSLTSLALSSLEPPDQVSFD